MSVHQTDFQDRVARILAGQGSTKTTIFVGQDHSFSYVPKHRRGRGGLMSTASNAGYALSFPACLLAGFASHVLERYATWVMMGVPRAPKNVDVELATVALTSACIAVVATHLLGFREKALLVPKLLGVALGLLFFHNLVHLYPQIFDQIFSPIWTAKITTMTEPSSLYFRGISIPF